jgi:N-acetylglucosamine malate deacetylase 1
MISDIQRVLVLAPHPDDAEISLGGTIARFVRNQVEVTVVNFTTSEYTEESAQGRRRAADEAKQILGHRLLWVEEGRHDQVEDIEEYKLVTIVDDLEKKQRPDIVFCPWVGDSHVDHVRLARATIASSRRWAARTHLIAYSPAEYRTLCYTQFHPNLYIDISKFVDAKLSAMRAFNKFGGIDFRPLEEEAYRKLWAYNGTLSKCEFAEAFLSLRSVW